MNVVPVVIVEANNDVEATSNNAPIRAYPNAEGLFDLSSFNTASPESTAEEHHPSGSWIRYTRTPSTTVRSLTVVPDTILSRKSPSLSLPAEFAGEKATRTSSLPDLSTKNRFISCAFPDTHSHIVSVNTANEFAESFHTYCSSEPCLLYSDLQNHNVKTVKEKHSTPVLYITDYSNLQSSWNALSDSPSKIVMQTSIQDYNRKEEVRLRKPGLLNSRFSLIDLVWSLPVIRQDEFTAFNGSETFRNLPTPHSDIRSDSLYPLPYYYPEVFPVKGSNANHSAETSVGINSESRHSVPCSHCVTASFSEPCAASPLTSSTESSSATPKTEKRRRRISLPVFRHFIDRCESWVRTQIKMHDTVNSTLTESLCCHGNCSISAGGQLKPSSSKTPENCPLLSVVSPQTSEKPNEEIKCGSPTVKLYNSVYRRKTLSLQETAKNKKQPSEQKSASFLTVPSMFPHRALASNVVESCPKCRAVSVDLGAAVRDENRFSAPSNKSQTTGSVQSLNSLRIPNWHRRLTIQGLSSRSVSDVDSQNSSFMASSSSMPDWTVQSALGEHLWIDTNASGDLCYVPEPECCRSGGKKKCTVCRITCHVKCMDSLAFACRQTYREADVREYRDEKARELHTVHHWVSRRRHDNRCKCCGKSFQAVFSFNSKEAVAKQCTWCKASYHSKSSCFDDSLLDEPCSMGTHAALVVPPHWIIKMPEKNTFKSSIRRTSSLICPPINDLEHTTSQLVTSVSRPDHLGQPVARESGSLRVASLTDGRVSPSTGLSNLILAPNLPFVIKPNPLTAAKQKPLLVFLNPRSGGNQGFSLLRKFQWLLNPRQVFDLSQGGPRMGLELFARVPNLRVLACGGDGTVGWVLSTIEELGLSPMPPVAVLPLGTGNDLARTLHWGAGYADEPISKILRSIEHGDIVALDRWHVDCEPRSDVAATSTNNEAEDGSRNRVLSATLPLKIFNNYFSFGADAATALEFHESREANPERFNSRLKNKMFYAGCGGKDLILRSWRDLSEHITLVCDGKDLTPLIRSLRPHAILFLNIPRYGSGTMPWGAVPPNAGFEPQQIDDGLLEVIGLSSNSLALLQVGGHGDRICQCRTVTLTTDKVIPMQMDGEPCRLLPSKIEIRCSHQALVVQKPGRHSGTLSRDTSAYFGGQRTDQVRLNIFVISLRDYEYISEDALALRGAAIFYGYVSVSPQENLASVRKSIVQIIGSGAEEASAGKKEESNPGFRLSDSWLFVDSTTAASRFFRIDSKREAAHFILDICNMEELFLIDDGLEPRLIDRTSGGKIPSDVQTGNEQCTQPVGQHSVSETPGNSQDGEISCVNLAVTRLPTEETQQIEERKLCTTTADVHQEPVNIKQSPQETQGTEKMLERCLQTADTVDQIRAQPADNVQPLRNSSLIDCDGQAEIAPTGQNPDVKSRTEAGDQLQTIADGLINQLITAESQPMIREALPNGKDSEGPDNGTTLCQTDESQRLSVEKSHPALRNDSLTSSIPLKQNTK